MTSPQEQDRLTDPDSTPQDMLNQTPQQGITDHETETHVADSEAETSIAPSAGSSPSPTSSSARQATGDDLVSVNRQSLSITQTVETTVRYRKTPPPSPSSMLKRLRESADEEDESPPTKRQRLENGSSSPHLSIESCEAPTNEESTQEGAHTEALTASSFVESPKTPQTSLDLDQIDMKSEIPAQDLAVGSPSEWRISPPFQPKLEASTGETSGPMTSVNDNASPGSAVPNPTNVRASTLPPHSTSSFSLDQTGNAQFGGVHQAPHTAVSSNVNDEADQGSHNSINSTHKKREIRDSLSPLRPNKIQKSKPNSKSKSKPKAKGARKQSTTPPHRPSTRLQTSALQEVVHMSLNYEHMNYINVSHVHDPVQILEAQEYIKEDD